MPKVYSPGEPPDKAFKTSDKMIGGVKVISHTAGYMQSLDPGVSQVKLGAGSGKSLSVDATKSNLTSRTKVGFKK
jgi:hypothetical protein